MYTPDHYAYDCLSIVREQPYEYISPDDVEIIVKGDIATFAWIDTKKVIIQISGHLTVPDIDAIFAAMNKAFRDGVDVGKDDAKADLRKALGL